MALTLLVASTGCWPHVTLSTLPDRSAPLSERFVAYRRVRPVVGGSWDFRLADGTRIHYAEDLLPLVDPASPVVQAATRVRAARRTYWILESIGLGAMAAAGAIYVTEPSSEGPAWWIGFGLLVAGAATVLAGPLATSSIVPDSRAVFDHLDLSLRHRLGLCGEGPEPIACPTEATAPAAAVSSGPR